MKLASHITIKKVGDGAIIFDSRRGEYLQLNPTAYFVMHQTLEGLQPRQIADELANEFRVSSDTALTDTLACLATFTSHKWLSTTAS